MNTTKYFTVIGATLLLAACSADGDLRQVDIEEPATHRHPLAGQAGSTPIGISCLVADANGATRAAFATQDETHVAAGRTVYVWADEHLKPLGLTLAAATDSVANSADCSEYIAAWALTADGNGGWTASTPALQYYPASGYPIDLFALCGNFTDKTFTAGQVYDGTLASATTWQLLNTKYADKADSEGESTVGSDESGAATPRPLAEHTVKANQSLSDDSYTTDGAFDAGVDGTSQNYFLSDLLYGRAYDREPQQAPQPIIMSHLLSKVEVYILLGNGLSYDNVWIDNAHRAKVTVTNTNRTARLVLSKQAKASATATTYTERQEPYGRSHDATAVTDYFQVQAVPPYDGDKGIIDCLMQYQKDGVAVEVPMVTGTGTETKTAYALAEAIVVPQTVKNELQEAEGTTVAQAATLLNISLPTSAEDSSTQTYHFRTNMTLKPGCCYKFYVTLTPTKIDFHYQVEDWTNVDRGSGNLILQ